MVCGELLYVPGKRVNSVQSPAAPPAPPVVFDGVGVGKADEFGREGVLEQ